jgi:hypothetical protein
MPILTVFTEPYDGQEKLLDADGVFDTPTGTSFAVCGDRVHTLLLDEDGRYTHVCTMAFDDPETAKATATYLANLDIRVTDFDEE